MAFRKAFGWAGVQSFIRIVIGFFSAKISAIYLGPPGMALVGQLNNFIDTVQGAVGTGPSTAMMNLTHRQRSNADRSRLWGTSIRLVLMLGGVLAVCAAACSSPVSAWLFETTRYWPVIVLAGLSIMMGPADSTLMGAMNGLGQIRLVAISSILSTVVGAIVFVSLTFKFGVWGALIGAACMQAIKFPLSLGLSTRAKLVTAKALFGQHDRATARDIAAFYPMVLAHAIAYPLGQILVRNSVAGDLGLERVGYLQAAWRLSDMYVGVLSTTLSLFFMAHFASLGSDAEKGRALRRVILQMFGLTTVAALSIFLMRDLVIRIVLTKKFLPMRELMPLQLCGDVIKMMVIPLQMALTNQRRIAAYAFQAIAGPALYVTFTRVLLPTLGLKAAPAAFVAGYSCIFILLVAFNWKLVGWRRALPRE